MCGWKKRNVNACERAYVWVFSFISSFVDHRIARYGHITRLYMSILWAHSVRLSYFDMIVRMYEYSITVSFSFLSSSEFLCVAFADGCRFLCLSVDTIADGGGQISNCAAQAPNYTRQTWVTAQAHMITLKITLDISSGWYGRVTYLISSAHNLPHWNSIIHKSISNGQSH